MIMLHDLHVTVCVCSEGSALFHIICANIFARIGKMPGFGLHRPQEFDVIIFLFFLGLALLRICKNRRTDTVQLLK